MSVVLKPQDIVVALKLGVIADKKASYSSLAGELGMSPSEVHAAVQRLTHAGLLQAHARQPNKTALLEFLIHGLKYAFPPDRGGVTRGMPTAHAAAPLAAKIEAGDDLPPVWPDPQGTVRGEAIAPLYDSVPRAARNDPKLYECLALVDALRSGRARERKLAESLLRERLAE
jgi:DNA-binding Lrp family transcriptional regulator